MSEHNIIPANNQPMKNITDKMRTMNDVLLGTGSGSNLWPGNKDFRTEAEKYRMDYVKAPRSKKAEISLKIVYYIRNKVPKGRFLKKNKETGLWFDVGRKIACEKVARLLREVSFMDAATLVEKINKSDALFLRQKHFGDSTSRYRSSTSSSQIICSKTHSKINAQTINDPAIFLVNSSERVRITGLESHDGTQMSGSSLNINNQGHTTLKTTPIAKIHQNPNASPLNNHFQGHRDVIQNDDRTLEANRPKYHNTASKIYQENIHVSQNDNSTESNGIYTQYSDRQPVLHPQSYNINVLQFPGHQAMSQHHAGNTNVPMQVNTNFQTSNFMNLGSKESSSSQSSKFNDIFSKHQMGSSSGSGNQEQLYPSVVVNEQQQSNHPIDSNATQNDIHKGQETMHTCSSYTPQHKFDTFAMHQSQDDSSTSMTNKAAFLDASSGTYWSKNPHNNSRFLQNSSHKGKIEPNYGNNVALRNVNVQNSNENRSSHNVYQKHRPAALLLLANGSSSTNITSTDMRTVESTDNYGYQQTMRSNNNRRTNTMMPENHEVNNQTNMIVSSNNTNNNFSDSQQQYPIQQNPPINMCTAPYVNCQNISSSHGYMTNVSQQHVNVLNGSCGESQNIRIFNRDYRSENENNFDSMHGSQIPGNQFHTNITKNMNMMTGMNTGGRGDNLCDGKSGGYHIYSHHHEPINQSNNMVSFMSQSNPNDQDTRATSNINHMSQLHPVIDIPDVRAQTTSRDNHYGSNH